jgi:capsular exopolysaccharide synthesis family protein
LPRAAVPGREILAEFPGTAGRNALALPPPNQPTGPDAATLLKSFKRRWLLAVSLGTVLAAAAAVGAWFLLEPKFTAVAWLRVLSHDTSLLGGNTNSRGDFGTYQRTLAARVKHPSILVAALKRDEIKHLPLVNQPEPIPFIQDELKVDLQEGSELVKVSMSAREPAELLALVNAVTQEWLKDASGQELDQQYKNVKDLEDVYLKAKNELRTKYDSLQRLAEKAGTKEAQVLTEKQKSLIISLTEYKNKHTEMAFKLMAAQGELALHQARAQNLQDAPVPAAALEEALEADTLVKAQTARIVQIQTVLDRMIAAGLRDDDSSLVGTKTLLARAQQTREARRAELRETLGKRYQEKARTQFDAELADLKGKVALLAEQEQKLRAEVERLSSQEEKIGTNSTELDALRREINEDEKEVARYGELWRARQVELRRPERVSIYQEAALQKRDAKRQILATAASPLAVFFGVCFAVSWWECRARRIHSAAEVVRGLGMRIVGAVPAIPPIGEGQFFADKDIDQQNQDLLESIDAIRTVLLRDAAVAATRVVMVTSALSGEGKTTLAGHLASSLARAGRRTLLMDCDLRTPAAHQLLEQTLQPGLSEVLLEEINLPEAVRPATAVEGLWLLPAGQWDREVVQALAQEGPQRIFEQLREEFDFIVVDSHPVLATADALLVGQHVDAVILSVLRDVSQVPPVSAALQRLTSLGIRVLGAVVNGAGPEDVYSQGSQYPLPISAR